MTWAQQLMPQHDGHNPSRWFDTTFTLLHPDYKLHGKILLLFDEHAYMPCTKPWALQRQFPSDTLQDHNNAHWSLAIVMSGDLVCRAADISDLI